MDREGFLETLKKQYTDRISASYFQFEHEGGSVDYPQLSAALQKLKKSAAAEGIRPADFDDLVHSVLPGVEGKVDLGSRPAPTKKAA